MAMREGVSTPTPPPHHHRSLYLLPLYRKTSKDLCRLLRAVCSDAVATKMRNRTQDGTISISSSEDWSLDLRDVCTLSLLRRPLLAPFLGFRADSVVSLSSPLSVEDSASRFDRALPLAADRV